jgi:hypothetical protein
MLLPAHPVKTRESAAARAAPVCNVLLFIGLYLIFSCSPSAGRFMLSLSYHKMGKNGNMNAQLFRKNRLHFLSQVL